MVTATLNVAGQLPITLRSIREQSLDGIEWLVADGGSTDGTVELLRQNADLVSWWISEPDCGIYDAWNKACARANGEWLLFMGAGDALANSNTLATARTTLLSAHPDHDLVYGQVELVSPRSRSVLETLGRPWDEVRDKWELGRPALPPHPGVFHHHSLFAEPDSFDIRFRVAADALLMLKAIHKKAPLYLPVVLTQVPVDGVSTRVEAMGAVIDEVREISSMLGIDVPWRHRLTVALQTMILRIFLAVVPAGQRLRVADLLRVLSGRARRWTVE